MKYGIHPFGSVSEAYVLLYANLEDATKRAYDLAHKYDIDVLVFEVLGAYRNRTTITWEKCDREGKDNGPNDL